MGTSKHPRVLPFQKHRAWSIPGQTRETGHLGGPSWEVSSTFFFSCKKPKYFHRLLLGEFHGKQAAFGNSGLERKCWMIENRFFFFLIFWIATL